MKFSSRQRIYFSIFSIVLVFSALILFVIWPIFLNIKETKALLLEKKQSITLLQQKELQVKFLESHYLNFQSSLDQIEQIFFKPSAEAILNFISSLDNLSEKTKVNLTVDAGDKKEDKNLSKFSFILKAIGSVQNVTDFMAALENMPYFIEIKQSDMKFFDRGKNLSAQISIIVYVQE